MVFLSTWTRLRHVVELQQRSEEYEDYKLGLLTWSNGLHGGGVKLARWNFSRHIHFIVKGAH